MIKTERLVLKPFEECDRESLILMLRNEKVNDTYLVPDLSNDETANKLFDRIKEVSYKPDRFARGIYLDNKLIGIINDTGIENGIIEIGYAINPEYWGRGYATEAFKGAIQYLFENGYSVIRAGIFEDNIASRRVLEKCGLKLTKTVEDIEYKGKMHHCVYFEIGR